MDQLFKKRKQELKDFASWLKKDKKTKKKEVPDHVFKLCPNCQKSIPYFTLKENHYVCSHCGHHFKLNADSRIKQIIDDTTFSELFKKVKTTDFTFPHYIEKIEKAKKESHLDEAVVCGVGEINKQKTVICIMDSHFMMGSMGKAVGEKITLSVEYATRKRLPLIIFCTSGGARMQEGIDSLMQMAKVSAALKQFSDQGGLYITVLTHPTTGGVSASFAMLGDIIIAEPKALIGFAGKRVIQDTIKEELPDDFQSAEFLLEKGFIDMIVERKDLKKVLSDLLKIHGG